MKSVGTSRIGLIRKINEDRFYIKEALAVVTDGMGGYIGGEIASTIAIDEIHDYIEVQQKVDERVLAEAIHNANREIHERIARQPELRGMGTTAVVAYVEGHTLYWANVGDSRLYVFENQKLRRVTTDHSLVQSLYDSGKINAEEALIHPQRNMLTRAVGVEPYVQVDCGREYISDTAYLLLCTDGLTGYVPETKIEEIFQREEKVERIMEDLEALAFETGARDNITIVVTSIIGEGGENNAG